jgi:hypothetical protein
VFNLSRRCFAASASSSAANPLAVVRPLKAMPLNLTGALGTYTAALWSAAAEKNATAAVTRDAHTFLNALKEPALARFVSNPFVSKADRSKALAPLAAKLGFNDVSKSFLNVLITANRLSGAPAVFQAFIDCSKAADGKIEGTLTTAHVSRLLLFFFFFFFFSSSFFFLAGSFRDRIRRGFEAGQHCDCQSAWFEQQGRQPRTPR